MLRTNRRTRSGFTLVELMIAAAITVMIMTILSVCFQLSMRAMSAMRAQGDAADQLRSFSTVMKRDLNADRHLPTEGNANIRNRGKRISDYAMNLVPPPGVPLPVPASGFFYLESPPSSNEGNDGAFDSFMNAPNATYPNGTRLWITSVLPGGADGNIYTATVNNTVVSSEAAELAYFLVQSTSQPATGYGANGTPQRLFNLHRRQRLIAMDQTKRAVLDTVLPFSSNISISQNRSIPGQANTMDSLLAGGRSNVVGAGSIFQPLGTGDDIILSNVISFEIKPTWKHSNGNNDPVQFGGRPAGTPAYFGQNHDWPFDDLTKATANTASFTFDSLTPMPVRMNGLQIRIRLYDPKAKTARQSTIIVDL